MKKKNRKEIMKLHSLNLKPINFKSTASPSCHCCLKLNRSNKKRYHFKLNKYLELLPHIVILNSDRTGRSSQVKKLEHTARYQNKHHDRLVKKQTVTRSYPEKLTPSKPKNLKLYYSRALKKIKSGRQALIKPILITNRIYLVRTHKKTHIAEIKTPTRSRAYILKLYFMEVTMITRQDPNTLMQPPPSTPSKTPTLSRSATAAATACSPRPYSPGSRPSHHKTHQIRLLQVFVTSLSSL